MSQFRYVFAGRHADSGPFDETIRIWDDRSGHPKCAASVLQAHILQDAEKLLNKLPAALIPAHARRFPTVSKLPKLWAHTYS
jgi:hypothetical protein